MKKKYMSMLLLSALNLSFGLVKADEPKTPTTAEQQARAAAAAERAKLKFTNKKNIDLMKMLSLLADRPKERSKFFEVMMAARKADQLRTAAISAEEFANRSKEIMKEIRSFVALFNAVPIEELLVESLDASPQMASLNASGRVKFLLSILKVAEAERENRLQASLDNTEEFKNILTEVSSVYLALMVNMDPTMRKAFVEHIKEMEAASAACTDNT